MLIDDLLRTTKEHGQDSGELTPDLFADFNGIPKGVDKTEFYQHDQNWSNRMIHGEQVMASLADGSRLIRRASHWHWPAHGSWARAIRSICSPISNVTDGEAERAPVRLFRGRRRETVASPMERLGKSAKTASAS